MLYGLTLIASTVDDTSTSLLRLLGRFKLISLYNIAREAARLVIVAAALVAFHSLIAVAIALVVHDVLAAGGIATLSSSIFARYTNRKVRIRQPALKAAREVRRPMLVMVFNMNIVTYGRLVQAQAPTLLLGVYSTATEVGIFKVATAVAAAVGTLYLPAWNAVMPRLSQLWVRRDIRAIRGLIRQGTKIAFLFLGTAGLLAIVFRSPLLTIFGSSKATAGGAVLAISVLTQVINGTTFWNDSLLYAMGRSGLVTAIYVPGLLILLPFLLVMLPAWGATVPRCGCWPAGLPATEGSVSPGFGFSAPRNAESRRRHGRSAMPGRRPPPLGSDAPILSRWSGSVRWPYRSATTCSSTPWRNCRRRRSSPYREGGRRPSSWIGSPPPTESATAS